MSNYVGCSHFVCKKARKICVHDCIFNELARKGLRCEYVPNFSFMLDFQLPGMIQIFCSSFEEKKSKDTT